MFTDCRLVLPNGRTVPIMDTELEEQALFFALAIKEDEYVISEKDVEVIWNELFVCYLAKKQRIGDN